MGRRTREAPIRVVVVAHGPPQRGGISTVAMDLVSDPGLNDEFEIVFLNTSQADDKRGELALENVVRAVAHAVQVFRLARRGAVVHPHSVQDPTLVAWRQVLIGLAARLRGARVMFHNHAYLVYMEAPGSYRPGRAHRIAYRLMNLLGDAQVLLSATGEANLRPLMPTIPMPVVANSVVVEDMDRSDVAGDPPVLLFVGELLERKGVLVLLDALDELDRRGVAYRLVIVGDDTPGRDPEKDRMIAAIDERGRGDTRTGPLPREQVFAQLAGADVFVFPTFVEGQPFSVIEAMAAGVPVVGSDIPTVAEMVGDGEQGLLVPPRDPEALAAALERVITDAALRRRLGEGGRARAGERFDRRVFREGVATWYRRLAR